MKKLNITSTVLDRLGFSEYWDENGTFGGRTLIFSNGVWFRIAEQEEMDDDTDGYGFGDAVYIANHFYFAGWFALPKTDMQHYDLFFLHEMYECIKNEYLDCVDEFVEKCRSVNMGSYIDEYIAESNKVAVMQQSELLIALQNIEKCCDNQNQTHKEIWRIAYSAINSA